MRKEFSTWLTIPTRWRDLDAMDHVNNATYLTYFEMCRMGYFDAIGISGMKEERGEGSVVASQTCNYRMQLPHPNVLECGFGCTKIGNSSFTLEYAIYLEGTDTIVCDGTSISAWIRYDTDESLRFPDILREAVAKHEKWPDVPS